MPGAVPDAGNTSVFKTKMPAFGKLTEETENNTGRIINKGKEAKTRRKIKQGKGNWSARVGRRGRGLQF